MSSTSFKKWIFSLSLIIGLILMMIVGIWLFSSQSLKISDPDISTSTSSSVQTPRVQTFAQMLENGADAIYLEDQTTGAVEVIVGYVIFSQPGFVVIFTDNDGVPGEAIGTSRFLTEGEEHLQITVREPLKQDAVYYAVLHRDDGDEVFVSNFDQQVLNAENSVVLMTFTAREDASPESSPVIP